MREAVIVSTARTPMAKAHRGEFSITPSPTLASFAVRAAVDLILTPEEEAFRGRLVRSAEVETMNGAAAGIRTFADKRLADFLSLRRGTVEQSH